MFSFLGMVVIEEGGDGGFDEIVSKLLLRLSLYLVVTMPEALAAVGGGVV
jgi:hypothetical protein